MRRTVIVATVAFALAVFAYTKLSTPSDSPIGKRADPQGATGEAQFQDFDDSLQPKGQAAGAITETADSAASISEAIDEKEAGLTTL